MSIKVNNVLITPTIFPDKTSQVWKLPEQLLTQSEYNIEWVFEQEAELFHLMQLMWLLDQSACVTLHMPYMPYGRQDKEVSNDSCFAQVPFMWLINNMGFDDVTTVDGHSKVSGVYSIYPADAICTALHDTGATHVCFPDTGAKERYDINYPCITMDKLRDPYTGEIKGLKIIEQPETQPAKMCILIVDDICDGGRTFIEAAKLLHTTYSTAVVSLYVSHGIFSKGMQVLLDAGIKHIFTKDGQAA
jgi:ribose-phosphate pyrophosphokinase